VIAIWAMIKPETRLTRYASTNKAEVTIISPWRYVRVSSGRTKQPAPTVFPVINNAHVRTGGRTRPFGKRVVVVPSPPPPTIVAGERSSAVPVVGVDTATAGRRVVAVVVVVVVVFLIVVVFDAFVAAADTVVGSGITKPYVWTGCSIS
jgi:hypothetical protein